MDVENHEVQAKKKLHFRTIFKYLIIFKIVSEKFFPFSLYNIKEKKSTKFTIHI